MKPTLKQIFDFGTEKVKKESLRFDQYDIERQYEYVAKRYNINTVTYCAYTWYDYSINQIARYLNINTNSILKYISFVKKNQTKQSLAEELFYSLEYLYDSGYFTPKEATLEDLKYKDLIELAGKSYMESFQPVSYYRNKQAVIKVIEETINALDFVYDTEGNYLNETI